jgi:hypothetical protein
MMHQLENLTVMQVEQLFDAPALVALLIAGADGNIEQSEIDRAIELVHIKTFSEYGDLQEFYKTLEPDFEKRFNHLRASLPQTKAERNLEISRRLEALNEVMFMLPYKFSHHLYKSLKNYAVHIANATGGLGIFTISENEKHYLHLDMLKEPTHHTE